MSARSMNDDSVGIFDFPSVLADERINDDNYIQYDYDDHDDVDSYFSDAAYDYEYDDNSNDSSSGNPMDDDSSSFNPDTDDDESFATSDDDLDRYVDVGIDDSCEDENSDDGDACESWDVPYFTPRDVPVEEIPYSEDIFAPMNAFSPPSSFLMQLQLQQLFNRNKASLKMYDDMIEIFNSYIASHDFNRYTKLRSLKVFLNEVEELFQTESFKPTYGSVILHNNSIATVPVFNMKSMMLSILHDTTVMRPENFAEGLDIFTGIADENCPANQCYGEIHTGDRWNQATKRFNGKDGNCMPLGLVIFGDKSHTDLHGALSLTPITFTFSFFNKTIRNNPDCWRPMAYIPNLAYGKGGNAKSENKVQDEHNCLAYSLRSLIDVSEAGGIRTTVMGKEVVLKPFIHYLIGDTEGHNKWLGHYQGSKPGTSRPYRDCHCSFEDLKNPMPNCTYTKASEFRRAIRMFETVHLKDNAIAMLKLQSRHAISNALYQSKLPLSNNVHGANKMCPPETLHVLDAGITIYMMESLRLLLPGGKFWSELDDAHIRMAYNIKRQSERDLPWGSIRNGIIDTTRCQSSERRGNLFLLVCIAHTASGEQLLKKGLGYNNSRWKKWVRLLKYYLAMTDEWFHDCRPKEEVRNGRVAVAEVMKGIQVLFPRSQDSHGYNIPKMHALSKVVEYICEFGSAINFYSGPGEASHKLFVKAPGRKTQRRMHEFASQTAGQYYYIMAIKKASMFVDTRSTNDKIIAELLRLGVQISLSSQWQVSIQSTSILMTLPGLGVRRVVNWSGTDWTPVWWMH